MLARKKLLLSLATMLLASPMVDANAKLVADVGQTPLTQQALQQFNKGDLEKAVALQEKALKASPKDWLSHAAMSYYGWQQGNIFTSVQEGERAVALAPTNYVALTNLALIKEGLDDCSGALALYRASAKVSPRESTPLLGQARCLTKVGKTDEAVALLQNMAKQPDQNFDWYFNVADTLMRMSKPEAAVAPAAKALQLANASQKDGATSLAYLAYLQAKQFDLARKLQDTVFSTATTKDQQIYIRTAVSILSPTEPAAAEPLLKHATAELKNEEDAETFYKIGMAFEQKSSAEGLDDASRKSWLESAASAFTTANIRAPRSKYYIALAGALGSLGKHEEMRTALTSASQLENWNTLSKYLLQNENSQLDKVSIKIGNLNCGCHISKVTEALGKIDGVAYVYVPSNVKPYEGVLLIDQSKTSVSDAFTKATEMTKAFYTKVVPPVVPDFSATATSKLANAADAIRTAQLAEFGDIQDFYVAFKAVVPFEPVSAAATRSNLASNGNRTK